MYGRVQHCIFNFKLWKDPRLSWNHSDYGGTSNIYLSANEVWILNMGLRNRYRIIYWSGMIFYGIILYIVGCSKLWNFAMLNDYLNSIIIIWYIYIYIFVIWIGNAYVAVAEKNWNICIYSQIYTGIYNINLIGTLKQCVVYRRQNIPCEILGKPNNTPRLLPIDESSVYQITNSEIGLATTEMEIM